MKKLLLACAALFMLASCEKKEETVPAGTNVHITGNVKGFKQGRLFLARRLNDSVATVIDTIEIKGNSAFTTHLKLNGPEMLELYIDRVSSNSIDDNLRIFVEPGNMDIQTSLDAFYANAKITGSENHKLYQEYLAQIKRLNDKSLDLREMKLNAEIKKNFEKADSLDKQINRMRDRMYLAAANFARIHPDKDIAPYLATREIPDINVKYLIIIDQNLTPKMHATAYGKELKRLIDYKKKNDPPATIQPEAQAK